MVGHEHDVSSFVLAGQQVQPAVFVKNHPFCLSVNSGKQFLYRGTEFEEFFLLECFLLRNGSAGNQPLKTAGILPGLIVGHQRTGGIQRFTHGHQCTYQQESSQNQYRHQKNHGFTSTFYVTLIIPFLAIIVKHQNKKKESEDSFYSLCTPWYSTNSSTLWPRSVSAMLPTMG